MRRVLLIEDNPIETRILSADFQKKASAEFDLISVQSLREAFELLKQHPIDVILLDLFLGDSSGLETLSRVREATPDTPVVVLTGLNDEALALDALKNGAQDYLIKGTVDSHGMFRAIRYAIERKQSECDRRLLEQRLLQSQKLEAVGTLAGGVSHNFNNTLTVILGHSKLMLEQMASDDDCRRHVQSIVKAGEKAAVLIRQLLTFSRKRTTEPTAVSLNKVIQDMHRLLESTVDNASDLELNLNAKSEFIKANPSQIGQMLMNLAMNARNAMSAGGKLTIETANHTDGKVLLTVRDTGCGMSPETCAHIFDPFFTTKGLAEASGLGLSTVYGIVKQHGGDIRVSSKIDEGTEFSIVFPVLETFADKPRYSHRPFTILVVQDGGSSQHCVHALDVIEDYTVIKATDWREAIDVADAHGGPIDLLIADTVNRGSVRPHLVKQLAGERPEMAIIYISNTSSENSKTNGELPTGVHLHEMTLTRETFLQSVRNALNVSPRNKTNPQVLEGVPSR